MNAPSVTANTEIPETAAASGFPPTAYRFFPNVVLFQMNHTIMIAANAHKIIVGNPFTLGIIIFGMVASIEPKDTPFVAYVTKPKITSMFAIVDMNGCILNFAVKNPAILVNTVHKTIHTTNAKTTLPPVVILREAVAVHAVIPAVLPVRQVVVLQEEDRYSIQ